MVGSGISGLAAGHVDLDHLLAHRVDDRFHTRVEVEILQAVRMWFFTVFPEMNSCFAMSRLVEALGDEAKAPPSSRSVSLGAGIWGRSSASLEIVPNSVRSFEASKLDADCPAPTLLIASANLVDRDLQAGSRRRRP